MKSIWTKIDRIVYILAAIVLGYLITLGISNLGNKAKGPLGGLAEKIEDFTYDIEARVVVQGKERSRQKQLSWFAPIAQNKASLMSQKNLLLGASDNFVRDSYETILALEDSLRINFPLIHIYAAWGSKPEQQFPALEAKVIADLGSVPVITWEPWVSDFDVKSMGLPEEMKAPKNSMFKVAEGHYDSYIKEWARKAKVFGKPFYLRWGHEMNDPTRYPWGAEKNQPQDYINAWRHVHAIFKAEGVDNVIWVWSPHLSYGPMNAYYPGAEYVDMVGCTVLNYGNAVFWSDWWSFDQIFGTHYQELSAFAKPIMIAEFASLTEGGNRNIWYRESINQVYDKYTNVKALLFFNYSDDKTVTDRSLNWSIHEDAQVLKELRNKITTVDSIAMQRL